MLHPLLKALGLLVLGMLFAGCETQATTATVNGVEYSETEIAEGKALYKQFCASCHGINGEGQFPDRPLLPDVTGRFGAPPHNGNGHTSHHPDSWLIEYVRDGGVSLQNPEVYYPMPAFGDQLSDGQIAQVIAYIKTIWNDK